MINIQKNKEWLVDTINFTRPEMRISCVGCGNMGHKLLQGWIESGYPRTHLTGVDNCQEKLKSIHDELGITVVVNLEAVWEKTDVILLAIKPKDIPIYLTSIRQLLEKSKSRAPVIASIAAGVPISYYRTVLEESIPCIRVMPNLAVGVRRGVTVMYSDTTVQNDKASTVLTELFSAVGKVFWVEDEISIDKMTAVSGSGPAYFFLLMEYMQKMAQKWGFSEQCAREIVQATAHGASTIAMQSDVDIGTLRANVSSKGGTTEKAITYFIQKKFDKIVSGAMQQAFEQATVLAQEAQSYQKKSDNEDKT